MGIIRDSFVIFKNWDEAIREAPADKQLELYHALMDFAMTGEIPSNATWEVRMFLKTLSENMEKTIVRYKASVENGKLGGRPPKETVVNDSNEPKITQENLEEPSHNLEEPSETYTNLDEPTHNLNVNVNDNIYLSKKVSKKVNKKLNINPRVRESYSELLTRLGFNEHCQGYIFKFIQHQQANGKVVTNAVLEDILNEIIDMAGIRCFGCAVSPPYDLSDSDMQEYILQAIDQALKKQEFVLKEPKGFKTRAEWKTT